MCDELEPNWAEAYVQRICTPMNPRWIKPWKDYKTTELDRHYRQKSGGSPHTRPTLSIS
jgi:hypothetical protein